jgi:hypothetical protein
VVILTARDATDDRVRGLDGGADHHVAKPFEMTELLARLRAVLRRRGATASPLLGNHLVSLDPKVELPTEARTRLATLRSGIERSRKLLEQMRRAARPERSSWSSRTTAPGSPRPSGSGCTMTSSTWPVPARVGRPSARRRRGNRVPRALAQDLRRVRRAVPDHHRRRGTPRPRGGSESRTGTSGPPRPRPPAAPTPMPVGLAPAPCTVSSERPADERLQLSGRRRGRGRPPSGRPAGPGPRRRPRRECRPAPNRTSASPGPRGRWPGRSRSGRWSCSS